MGRNLTKHKYIVIEKENKYIESSKKIGEFFDRSRFYGRFEAKKRIPIKSSNCQSSKVTQ